MKSIPPRSGFGLIQEDLWPDEWKILVSCMLLNCTSRKQVEKILPTFFLKWPNADALINAKTSDISETISSLGFRNRRTNTLVKMSKEYLKKQWKDPIELPGIGEYASRAWQIFFANNLGDIPPQDGALVIYWNWRKKHGY